MPSSSPAIPVSTVSGQDFVPGRVCEATVYYLPAGGLDVLKFDVDAASQGKPVTFTIGPVDRDTFSHKPVLTPRKLEHDEAFVVAVAKQRPVVIMSTAISIPAVSGLPRQNFRDMFLVCPLFSFRDTHPDEFRFRVQAFEYNMAFYLPGSDEFELHEGFLRFDRCLIVPKGQLRLGKAMLTDDALYALRGYFGWFLTGELEEPFAGRRRELIELLNRTPGS